METQNIILSATHVIQPHLEPINLSSDYKEILKLKKMPDRDGSGVDPTLLLIFWAMVPMLVSTMIILDLVMYV